MEISREAISRIEKLLLSDDASFSDKNDERIEVIQNLETVDVNASPGSGKTTTLLAKLLLLAEQMPFNDGRGICVLTHTNVAIDELKASQIDNAFNYPNYFGTFQKFVNKFLAIPFFVSKLKVRPDRLEKEYYDEVINNTYWVRGYSQDINKKALHYLNVYRVRNLISLNRNEDEELILTKGINGDPIEIKKPWNARGEWNNDLKKRIFRWLIDLKKKMMKEYRLLSYDDSYFLAFESLRKYPHLKKALSKRFKYVFVDEMQDTNLHQLKILDKCFDGSVIIQKFGDPHQSIYNKVSVKNRWNPSEDALAISGSKRFGKSIANVLRTVCIKPNLNLQGNESVESFQPHIIVYDEKTVSSVLPRFVELVKEFGLDKISKEKKTSN